MSEAPNQVEAVVALLRKLEAHRPDFETAGAVIAELEAHAEMRAALAAAANGDLIAAFDNVVAAANATARNLVQSARVTASDILARASAAAENISKATEIAARELLAAQADTRVHRAKIATT